jgi:hypothetical protein
MLLLTVPMGWVGSQYKLLEPDVPEGVRRRDSCMCFCIFWYYYYLSIVQINLFRPRTNHSTTESQTFLFSLNIFSWSALAGGDQIFFQLGPKPLSAALAARYAKRCDWVVAAEVVTFTYRRVGWVVNSFA